MRVLKYIIAVLICELTGITSGLLANAGDNAWFDSLNKPSWNPPDSLFGPVWITLYALMGISLGLVWNSSGREEKKNQAMIVFAVQLFLNFWWSVLFFRFHMMGLAFAEILLMIVLIITTIFLFSRFSKIASWLMVPYVAWVCFASILNFTIWQMNS